MFIYNSILNLLYIVINEGPKESVYANKLGGGGHEFTIHDSTYDMYCVIDRTYYMHRFASTFTVKTLIAAAEIVRFFFLKNKQNSTYCYMHNQRQIIILLKFSHSLYVLYRKILLINTFLLRKTYIS